MTITHSTRIGLCGSDTEHPPLPSMGKDQVPSPVCMLSIHVCSLNCSICGESAGAELKDQRPINGVLRY